MQLPNNQVAVRVENDCIRITIFMVHPRWISNLLFVVALLLTGLLMLGLVYFNLLEIIGPGALALSAIWLIFIFRITKVACWHRYGQEDYIIADLAFSHQRSYGIYTSALESVKDVGYQIGFLETSEPSAPEVERKGLLTFYTIDSITKIESILFESALEISLKEYDMILFNFMAIRHQDKIDISSIFLN